MFIRSASALVLCVAAFSAHATGTLFRSYLSSTGSDSNPCTLAAPCRLLPAALSQTADDGEVWMLDSANYNTGGVTISQNVTILAVPGAVASLVANNDNAVDIPTTSVKVTLRNLSIRNLTGSNNSGIGLSGGSSQLIVEGSEFSGLHVGVDVDVFGADVVIQNSIFRDNDLALVIAGQVGGPYVMARALVDHCTIVGSSQTAVTGYYANMTFSHSTVTSSHLGIDAQEGALILLEDSQITQNTTGVLVGFGSVQTTGTNNIKFNGTNIYNGSLTPVSHD